MRRRFAYTASRSAAFILPVFVYWFRRSGSDVVDLHWLPASRGWASLTDPPDDPEAFAKGGGHRSSLPSKEMSALQRHVRADDIITCFDDRTGKQLWQRVFHGRGLNHVRVYTPPVRSLRSGRPTLRTGLQRTHV